jgi:hypothetical protein
LINSSVAAQRAAEAQDTFPEPIQELGVAVRAGMTENQLGIPKE